MKPKKKRQVQIFNLKYQYAPTLLSKSYSISIAAKFEVLVFGFGISIT